MECKYKNPKEHNACEKGYIWNPATYICKNSEYLARIINDSVIMCDGIINTADSVSTNVQEMLWVLCQQMSWVLRQ